MKQFNYLRYKVAIWTVIVCVCGINKENMTNT